MDDSTKARPPSRGVVALMLAVVASVAAADAQAACDPKTKPATFEQFKACTYREPDSKIWIVDGDVPIVEEEALRRFYEAIVEAPATTSRAPALGRAPATLIVNRVNNADDVWASGKRCGISYCVSRASTGTRYQAVVDAMAASTAAWSSNMGVKFVHAADQDNSCTATNQQVDFDVQVVSGQPYLARAFFPAQARATRNVNIDTTSFSATPPLTLEGVLRHELGHAIGFRHEHTRPEAGQCFEDNSWRALTPYDSASVMHYPQCGGTAGWLLALSPGDISGGTVLYGAASTCASQPAGAAVTCRVFNDGYASATGLSDALYFRAKSSICVPDTTAKGTCRKWFGRCQTPTGERVNFTVFNDGATNRTPPSDAVYIRQPLAACTPGGTGTSNCRKWVGLPTTASGKPAKCYLFDDGYARVVGPTDAIYAKGPNHRCACPMEARPAPAADGSADARSPERGKATRAGRLARRPRDDGIVRGADARDDGRLDRPGRDGTRDRGRGRPGRVAVDDRDAGGVRHPSYRLGDRVRHARHRRRKAMGGGALRRDLEGLRRLSRGRHAVADVHEPTPGRGDRGDGRDRDPARQRRRRPRRADRRASRFTRERRDERDDRRARCQRRRVGRGGGHRVGAGAVEAPLPRDRRLCRAVGRGAGPAGRQGPRRLRARPGLEGRGRPQQRHRRQQQGRGRRAGPRHRADLLGRHESHRDAEAGRCPSLPGRRDRLAVAQHRPLHGDHRPAPHDRFQGEDDLSHRPFRPGRRSGADARGGLSAVRVTEAHEHYDRQHQDLRVENGRVFGDTIDFVDFGYLAQVTRLNALTLASMAAAPAPPTGVAIEGAVNHDTTVTWQPVPGAASYRVWWRDTTAAQWQNHRDVRVVDGAPPRVVLNDIVIDDWAFGVSSIDAMGNESPVVYPGDAGSF